MSSQNNSPETVLITCPHCGVGARVNKAKLPMHEVVATCQNPGQIYLSLISKK